MAPSVLLMVALAAVAATAAETSTVVSLFLPQADPQPLVASIVGVDSTATTYAYSCVPGSKANECGFTTSETITLGTSTVQLTYSFSNSESGIYSESTNCKLDPKADLATCTVDVSQSGPSSNFHTSTVTSEPYLTFMQPATITAGLNKLNGGGAAPTTSGSNPTATPDESQSTGASTGDGTKQSITTSPNAAPAATQKALLAGVAAVVGAIAL